jgi:hypothetical protein
MEGTKLKYQGHIGVIPECFTVCVCWGGGGCGATFVKPIEVRE